MTRQNSVVVTERQNFNPHEREARDQFAAMIAAATGDFNPHEREARDLLTLTDALR